MKKLLLLAALCWSYSAKAANCGDLCCGAHHACTNDWDCCNQNCNNGTHTCGACQPNGSGCGQSSDCCGGGCIGFTCTGACSAAGQQCQYGCCNGAHCDGGLCCNATGTASSSTALCCSTHSYASGGGGGITCCDPPGSNCATSAECCPGETCNLGTCSCISAGLPDQGSGSNCCGGCSAGGTCLGLYGDLCNFASDCCSSHCRGVDAGHGPQCCFPDGTYVGTMGPYQGPCCSGSGTNGAITFHGYCGCDPQGVPPSIPNTCCAGLSVSCTPDGGSQCCYTTGTSVGVGNGDKCCTLYESSGTCATKPNATACIRQGICIEQCTNAPCTTEGFCKCDPNGTLVPDAGQCCSDVTKDAGASSMQSCTVHSTGYHGCDAGNNCSSGICTAGVCG